MGLVGIRKHVRELCAQTDRQTDRTNDRQTARITQLRLRLGEAIALMIVAKDMSRHAGITMRIASAVK